MTTVLTTFAKASVVEAEVIAAVSRTKARVAAQASAFCGDHSTTVWFPVAPGVTQPAAPTPTTNASPAPPNSVPIPPGFDPTDTCYIFQDLLPLNTAPVYAEELEPTVILEPYNETVPLLGITVATLSIREYPYELTLPSASIAAVTYARITYNIVVPSVDMQFAGAAPVITQSINARVNAAADVVIGSDVPVVGQLVGIYIEAPAPPSIAIEALTPVVTPSTQLRPAAADVAQVADTVRVPGSVQIRPAAADIAKASLTPEVGRIIGIHIQPSSAAIEVAAPVPTAP